MSEDLVRSVERLRLDTASFVNDDTSIDDILFDKRPRKKKHESVEEIKAKIERGFLTPSTSFGPDWLNKLQQ